MSQQTVSAAPVPPEPGGRPARRRLSRWLARLQDSFLGRCAQAFLDVQGIDRAMAIAAQAFTALVPLLLLTSQLSGGGDGNSAADAIVRRFHLTGESAQAVQQFFAKPGGGGSIGVLSAVILLFSGVSFTRRVQRMYQQAWQMEPRKGVRGSMNAALGLAALLLEIILLSSVLSLLRGLPLGDVLAWPVSILTSLVLWTSVPWLLLDRQIHWRRLLPGGALAALCASCYGFATAIYMPRLIESYSRRYGLFGITLALIGWLLATAVIVVGATVVAAEFDRAEEPWARRLRARLLGQHARDDDPAHAPGVRSEN